MVTVFLVSIEVEAVSSLNYCQLRGARKFAHNIELESHIETVKPDPVLLYSHLSHAFHINEVV